MKSLRFFDSRAGYSLASLGLLLGMVVPAAFPAFASAENQITSRSMSLSSAASGATGVDYKLVFSPATLEATGAVVVLFCDDSPIPGQTCTTPTGFDASSATLGTGSDTATITAKAAGYIELTAALSDSAASTFVFSGITNPSAATTGSGAHGGFYARVQTYASESDANTGVSGAPAVGAVVDDGGIAMAIQDAIGVKAAVRETMTFCISHSAPTVNCGGTDTASLTLGHGTPEALDATAFDTASDYTQISTNALGGAVVSLKNNNDCGGLKRGGASVCDIAPAETGDAIAAGTAKFGMKLGTPDTLLNGSGSVVAAADFAGTSSNYGMTYSGTTGSGVSSNYGAEIYHSTGPINNVNVPMTFAASASNATPAGLYQATLSLIATGTY